MVMTLAKITAGTGYTYLTRHTARGDADQGNDHDAAAYYTAQGNPPGRWTGRGAPLLGRQFPVYKQLEPFGQRVEMRLDLIRQETRREPAEAEIKKVKAEEARRQRAAVAGFDLGFSPVKSAALLWALDERPWVRDAIRDAHEEAMNAALELLEDHAALTRTGTDGVAQIATSSVLVPAG